MGWCECFNRFSQVLPEFLLLKQFTRIGVERCDAALVDSVEGINVKQRFLSAVVIDTDIFGNTAQP